MPKIRVTAIDDPEGTEYELAPEHLARRIRQRFESSAPTVWHPIETWVLIHDPGNWWDGPTHLTWEPENGHFAFESWPTPSAPDGKQHFPLIGPLH